MTLILPCPAEGGAGLERALPPLLWRAILALLAPGRPGYPRSHHRPPRRASSRGRPRGAAPSPPPPEGLGRRLLRRLRPSAGGDRCARGGESAVAERAIGDGGAS